MLSMWRIVTALLVCGFSGRASCIAIEGGQLFARDLAKADRAFATLDPSLVFSFAPVPGNQRVVSASDLEKWASDHGLQIAHAASVCFERVARIPDIREVADALRRAIGPDFEDLQLEVIDVCQCQVPAGRLEFPLAGASLPPSAHPETPVLWRGRLISADGAAYPVWARVRVLASIKALRAVTDLHARQVLTRRDLEEVNVSGSPLCSLQSGPLAGYEGKVMKISLARGSILRPEFVRTPSEIERGSLVQVEVVNGAARLSLEARAESAGNTGQIITLTNPAGAARFHAVITGPGRAEVVLSKGNSQGTAFLSEVSRPENAVVGRSF